jgi:hypothetical protein
MIDAFVQKRTPLSASQVDLGLSMRSTGVWKQDAKLGAIAEVAASFLALYNDADPSDPRLKLRLLGDFEVIWREVIDHFLDKRRPLFWEFVGGGHLFQDLLGPESYAMLTSIRKQVIQNRKREQGPGSSGGAGISITEEDTRRQ